MNDSFDGPVSVVVTSISAPNAELRELASQCKARGFSYFVMGDLRSPQDFSIDGCDFFSLQRQRETDFKIAEILPARHYARKNIGYLLAIRTRPAMLLETDDDNMPLANFWDARTARMRVPTLAANGWTNVYGYFTDANIWPRGLPLDAVQRPLPDFGALPVTELDCPIQPGLADEDPDVDAIYRLLLPLPVSFRRDRWLALAPGTWCPFNSQNTAWFPQAYPLLYLPSYCSIRMTDIWRGFVAQRIAWENGWSVLFKGPDVYQRRNEHNLMKDFADEVPGYLHNRSIAQHLDALKLEAGAQNLGDNLIRCYQELVRLDLVGREELPLVKAWVRDLAESC